MTTTRPDHPLPEVVALAEAMLSADPDYQFAAEMILRHLPAPFAVVDMDALTERVAQAMSGYGNPTIDWHREARAAIEGGRT